MAPDGPPTVAELSLYFQRRTMDFMYRRVAAAIHRSHHSDVKVLWNIEH